MGLIRLLDLLRLGANRYLVYVDQRLQVRVHFYPLHHTDDAIPEDFYQYFQMIVALERATDDVGHLDNGRDRRRYIDHGDQSTVFLAVHFEALIVQREGDLGPHGF